MVLHSSLTAASAEAHRHDLLVDAERYRTTRRVLEDSARSERRAVGPSPPVRSLAVRRALRRVVRPSVRPPDPPPRWEAEKQDEECRYAVSR